jgi:hypothetical protein
MKEKRKRRTFSWESSSHGRPERERLGFHSTRKMSGGGVGIRLVY